MSIFSTQQPLRVAVMGAGAIGCYYGGLLARAGHDVVLIGRAQHVQAIERDGLVLEMGGQDLQIPLRASTETAALGNAQLVLFCVKANDTESAGVEMRTHLAPGALVLCLQNGVDNAERLRMVLPDHEVAAVVVYVATEMVGPGRVRHHGRGDLLVQRSEACTALAPVLTAAGIPVELSGNARGALWLKLICNCAYNAIGAIAMRPNGENVQREGIAQVIHDVVEECLAVARAEGVEVPGDVHAVVRRIAETMPGQYSSTAQDLMRGRRSEIDHLNGLVVRRGQALGVPTPANRVLWALVRLLEEKPRT